MGIFLIILVVICLCWPWISRWVSRWFSGFMSRRAEDMMRRMMGMPSRKEEQRRQKQARRQQTQGQSGGNHDPRRHHRPAKQDAAELMKSVAVDVEYTEIKEFESRTIVEDDGRTRRVQTEEQVSDAEFTEVRHN